MDLVFTRSELLNVDLPEHVLGKRFEDAWRSTFRATAKRALITAGVDDRVPFIVAADGTIVTDLTRVLKTFSGQTSGRTTMSRGGSRNLDSGDKWIADLTAAMLAARGRQDE